MTSSRAVDRHTSDEAPRVPRRDFLRTALAGGAGLLTGGIGSLVPRSLLAASPSDWIEATIPQLQSLFQSGALTSEELTRGYLSRIAQLNPVLAAVIETNPDAIAIAQKLDTERRTGRVRGPLHGIPVLVKDNLATNDGMQTTAGSLALLGSKPPSDATVVDRLRAAGAVILGKANLSEWANFRGNAPFNGWSARGGFTRDPYLLSFDPCGSSSGSAVAAAANLCAAAIGTETDGSIVCPSGNSLIVGLKPTLGLVSQDGIIPIAHSQDTAGPMCRTVTDAAILLGVLEGAAPDPDDPATGRCPRETDYTRHLDRNALRGARIGIPRAFYYDKTTPPGAEKPRGGLDEAPAKVMAEAIEVLKREGAVMSRAAGILCAVGSVLASMYGFPAPEALALPRYSARYGQSCALCHVNPTGGGMRTLYASQDIVPREFAWSRATAESLMGIDPRVGPNLTIGTDFREIYYSDHGEARLGANTRGFFQMQGDLYLAFQLGHKTTLYYDRSTTDTREAFAVHYLTPGLYLKAGQFVPSEGWKFDDHTMFVRADLGFYPPAISDVGIELGALVRGLDAQVALLNGNRGSRLDNNGDLAAAANAVYRFRAGPANLALGATGHRQRGPQKLDVAGAYGYLNWRGLTWVGQGDLEWTTPASPDSGRVGVMSHEVSLVLHRGLDLLATYDFLDPDVDRPGDTAWRMGGGVHLMPVSYAVLEALYRTTRGNAGPAFPAGDFDEVVFQLHVLY